MALRYVVMESDPGCLPEGEPFVVDSPDDGWRAHLESVGDARWEPDDPDDPGGPHSMTPLALDLERAEARRFVGTVYGEVNGSTRAFSVEYAEEDDD